MSLKDWLPKNDDNFFALERDPKIEFHGITIRPDRFIKDFRTRNIFERLFSRPWKPFLKHVPTDYAYVIDNNQVLVSWKTYSKIKEMTQDPAKQA
jgi:hypothetical protein